MGDLGSFLSGLAATVGLIDGASHELPGGMSFDGFTRTLGLEDQYGNETHIYTRENADGSTTQIWDEGGDGTPDSIHYHYAGGGYGVDSNLDGNIDIVGTFGG